MTQQLAQGIRGFVDAKSPCLPILPFLHTTDGQGFVDIVSAGELTPQLCHVFKEDLLYFFYGRPAYRANSQTDATTLGAFMPVCFLLEPEGFSDIERLFPFDSGAFANDRFKGKFHPRMTLDDFALTTELNIPARFVTAFFGSNENYYHARVSELDSIDPLEFAVEMYHSLVRDRGQTPYDDRRSTVEVQSRIRVKLSKETVLAVVLPLYFCDNLRVQEKVIGEWDASLLTYKSSHMMPVEYTGQIRELVEGYLREKRYL